MDRTELPVSGNDSKNKNQIVLQKYSVSLKQFKNIATLHDLDTGKEYPLPNKAGIYSVGRKDVDYIGMKPDIEIDTTDEYMSHIQIFIRVEKYEDGYYHHFTINKNAVNSVFLNGNLKTNDDINRETEFPLQRNDCICMPFARIIIIDKSRTEDGNWNK